MIRQQSDGAVMDAAARACGVSQSTFKEDRFGSAIG